MCRFTIFSNGNKCGERSLQSRLYYRSGRKLGKSAGQCCKSAIFAICSKYVDFFMGWEIVSYSLDCGQVADPV